MFINEVVNINIYEKLNSKYNGRWSIKNTSISTQVPESRMCLFVDLEIDNRTIVGCSSMPCDFSEDITEKLLDRAVQSAYRKLKFMSMGDKS